MNNRDVMINNFYNFIIFYIIRLIICIEIHSLKKNDTNDQNLKLKL